MKFRITEIMFGSPEYDDTVKLRTEVLRKPLKLEFYAEDLELEFDQFHFGLYDSSAELVACLILKEVKENNLKMRQVSVSPLHQRKGLGKVLVENSELWAKFKGYDRIVLAARDTAVEFYLSMGYEIEGEMFEEVGIPHRSMFKVL